MPDVIVVGGGIGGLMAATSLARAGRSVVVFERRGEAGGRARSLTEDGCVRNLGPHALFDAGPAAATLRELGVRWTGRRSTGATVAGWQGGLVPLPAGPLGLLGLSWMSAGEKLEAAVRFVRLGRAAARGEGTVGEWLADASPPVAALVRTLLRVATYAHPVDALPLRRAAAQLQLALAGVSYLDGGWQTLVDGLRAAFSRHGGELRVGAEVLHAEADHVLTADGRVDARQVILAVHAPAARRLGVPPTNHAAARAASLDLCLRDPDPRWPAVALDMDAGRYLSDHGRVAQLAPPGHTLIHAAAYLAPDEAADRAAVEAWADRATPGWRDRVVSARWTGAVVVQHALPRVDAPRQPVEDERGLLHVGDHVESPFMLLDAVADSARRAVAITLRGAAARAA
jgi:phytoene dehydrogenase-like protein